MHQQNRPPATSRLTTHLKRTMGPGLVILVPGIITYLVLKFLFNTVDGVLQPAVKQAFGRDIPGLGLVIVILIVYVVGLLLRNYVGKWLVGLLQRLLLGVPVVSPVYAAARQVTEFLSGSGTTTFKRAVAIEFPRRGCWTLGFLVAITSDERGTPLVQVYVPAGPSPHTGWVVMMPVDEVFDTDMSVPDALRLLLSGGVITPPQVNKKPLDVGIALQG